MAPEHDHGDIFETALARVKSIFDQSGQAMFLYLDNENMGGNGRFAKMLGYQTPDEWAKAVHTEHTEFMDPTTFGASVAQVGAAMGRAEAIQLDVAWLDRSGKRVPSKAIVVPFDVEGHRFALNFISPL